MCVCKGVYSWKPAKNKVLDFQRMLPLTIQCNFQIANPLLSLYKATDSIPLKLRLESVAVFLNEISPNSDQNQLIIPEKKQ